MNTDNARKAGYDIFKVADIEALRASVAGYERDNAALHQRNEYVERENDALRGALSSAVSICDGLYSLLAKAGYKPDSSACHQLEILRSQLTANALATAQHGVEKL